MKEFKKLRWKGTSTINFQSIDLLFLGNGNDDSR